MHYRMPGKKGSVRDSNLSVPQTSILVRWIRSTLTFNTEWTPNRFFWGRQYNSEVCRSMLTRLTESAQCSSEFEQTTISNLNFRLNNCTTLGVFYFDSRPNIYISLKWHLPIKRSWGSTFSEMEMKIFTLLVVVFALGFYRCKFCPIVGLNDWPLDWIKVTPRHNISNIPLPEHVIITASWLLSCVFIPGRKN